MTLDTGILETGADPAMAKDRPEAASSWLAAMDAIAEEDGYLEPLGRQHWAFFAEAGSQLLVSFERAETIRASADHLPAVWQLARQKGWSLLCLIAEGETFWRAPEVWGYFDRLVDEALFDDFDQVLFYGAGPAAHAAASYGVAAPGARLLLVSPLATLAPAIAGFDQRYRAARRLDFTSRYGYAPHMIEAADHVWLLHDPQQPEDSAHAALFRRDWVTVLRLRWTGSDTERALQATGLLGPLIEAVMRGHLSTLGFARLWRRRRDNPAYLQRLLAAAQQAGRRKRELAICRSAGNRLKLRPFLRRLNALEAATE